MAVYASLHPEKVEGIFLLSPGGMQFYNPDFYDPTKFLDHTKLSTNTSQEEFGRPYSE